MQDYEQEDNHGGGNLGWTDWFHLKIVRCHSVYVACR
jgi:hypothetical protein